MAEILPLPYKGEGTVPPIDLSQLANATGINTCLARAAQTFEQYVVGTQQFPDVDLPELKITDLSTNDWEDKASQVLGKFFGTRPQLFHRTFGFPRQAWNGRIEVVPLEMPVAEDAPTLVVAAPILAKSPGNALALHLVPNTILGAAQPRKNGKPFEVFGDVLVFQKRVVGRRVDLTGVPASVVMRALWELPAVQSTLTVVVKRLGISFLTNQFAWISKLPLVELDDPLLLDPTLAPSADFMCYEYKTKLCSRSDQHETEACPFGHVRSNGRGDTTLMDVRRPVRDDQVERLYCAELCFEVAPPPSSGEKVVLVGYKSCSRGQGCAYCHSLVEKLYHPDVYRTKACNGCKNPRFCAFWHAEEQRRKGAPRSQNNSRQVTPQSSRRVSATGEHDDAGSVGGAASPRTWPSPHSTPRREREGRGRGLGGSNPHSRSPSQHAASPFESVAVQQLPHDMLQGGGPSLAPVAEEMRAGSLTLAQRGNTALSLIRLPSSLDLRASSITVLHRSGSITAVPHRPGASQQQAHSGGHAVLDLRSGSITTMLAAQGSLGGAKRGDARRGMPPSGIPAAAGQRRPGSEGLGDGGRDRSSIDGGLSGPDLHPSSLHMPSVTSLLSKPGGRDSGGSADGSGAPGGLLDGGYSGLPYYDYFSTATGYDDLAFNPAGMSTSSVLRSGAVSPLSYASTGTYTPPLASQGYNELANSAAVSDLVMRSGQYLSGNAAYYAAAAAVAANSFAPQEQLQGMQMGGGLFGNQDSLTNFNRDANGTAAGMVQGPGRFGLSDGYADLETEPMQSAPSFQSLLGATGLMGTQPAAPGTVTLRLSLPGADYPVDLLGCTADTAAAELLLTLQAHPDYATQLRHNTTSNTLLLLQPPAAAGSRQPLHLRALRFDGRLGDCLGEEAFAVGATAGPTTVAGMIHRVTTFEEDLAAEPGDTRPLLRQFARIGSRVISRLVDLADLPKGVMPQPGKAGKAAVLRAWLEAAFDMAERQGQLWQHIPGTCCFHTGLYCHPPGAPPQPIFLFFDSAQRHGASGPPYSLTRPRRQLSVGEDAAAGLLEHLLGVRLAWLPSAPEGVVLPELPVAFASVAELEEAFLGGMGWSKLTNGLNPGSPRQRLELSLTLADPALTHHLAAVGVLPPRMPATTATCVEDVHCELGTWLSDILQRAAEEAASGSSAWQTVEADLEALEASEMLLLCTIGSASGSQVGNGMLRVLRREPVYIQAGSGGRRKVHSVLGHHDFIQALLGEEPQSPGRSLQVHVRVHFSGRGYGEPVGQLLWEVVDDADSAALYKAVAATAEGEWWGPEASPRVLRHLLQQRFAAQEACGGLAVRCMQRDGAIGAMITLGGQLLQPKRFSRGQEFLVFSTGLNTPSKEEVLVFLQRSVAAAPSAPWRLWDVLRASEALAAVSQLPPPPVFRMAPYHAELRMVSDVEALLAVEAHRHWLRSCVPQLPEAFYRSALYGAVFMALQDVQGTQQTVLQRLHPSGQTQFLLPLHLESELKPTGPRRSAPRLVVVAQLHTPGDAEAVDPAADSLAALPPGSHYRVVGMLPALAAVVDARACGRLGPAWALDVLEDAARTDAHSLMHI